MTGVRQWCASCGAEMTRRPDGAWTPGCARPGCHKAGYMATAVPSIPDRWSAPVLVMTAPLQTGVLATTYFYPSPEWDWSRRPSQPR